MASFSIPFTFSLILSILSVSAQSIDRTLNSVIFTTNTPSPLPSHHPLQSDDLRPIDIVLLASVDGRFYGLNRTTGEVVWTTDAPGSKAIDLYALVRTEHPELGGGASMVDMDNLSLSSEDIFIIEPQSGHIFLNPAGARCDGPLQRLPFSMAQLVDMSPFRFDDGKTFVGKKRGSFISLDLRLGKIMEISDPEQSTRGDGRNELSDELLDRLDGTVVYIRRTDYHVSVFSKGRVIQNLTYSAYDPKDIDKKVKYLWHQMPDSWYHQPTPDGSLLVFKTDEREPLRHLVKFEHPIVAVFDTVTTSDRTYPLLLLQPTPSLQDLYPSRREEVTKLVLKGRIVYVGRIGDSLYALSHQTYPHVLFSPLPTQRTFEDDSLYRLFHDTNEFGEGCTSLDCLIGAHYIETASP
ncbi:bifunctional endoribonuclease/protein kinase ire1 [Tulasnella sp. JGI-2019a]|nr:bifunctional endoribonuclease/protein kinase ire1 [Tulasnella sp. JGI-2019a]